MTTKSSRHADPVGQGAFPWTLGEKEGQATGLSTGTQSRSKHFLIRAEILEGRLLHRDPSGSRDGPSTTTLQPGLVSGPGVGTQSSLHECMHTCTHPHVRTHAHTYRAPNTGTHSPQYTSIHMYPYTYTLIDTHNLSHPQAHTSCVNTHTHTHLHLLHFFLFHRLQLKIYCAVCRVVFI